MLWYLPHRVPGRPGYPAERIDTAGPPGLHRTAVYPEELGPWRIAPPDVRSDSNRPYRAFSADSTPLPLPVPTLLLSHDPLFGRGGVCENLERIPGPTGTADIYINIYSDLGGKNPLRRYHSKPWAGKSGIGGRTNPVKLDVKRSQFPGLLADVLRRTQPSLGETLANFKFLPCNSWHEA